jgi:hypothetical protein
VIWLAALAAAEVQPPVVATIDPRHRLVEGVATDGSTIFVSSVLDGMIVACKRTCRDWATLPQGLHPLGITWDGTRGGLWVAADCPDIPGVAKCERGALVLFNGAGRLRGTIAPPQGPFHPGDVSASRSGVFVSDSQTGLVWSLLVGRRGLRAVNRPGDGKSAQGTALAPSGTALVVADYSRGIGSIDLKTTATRWLPRQDGKPLRGVDGLVRCGDGFIGVYNGEAPGQILTIRMRPGGIEYRELVKGLTLPDPTQIAFDGKRLLAVADSGWAVIGKAASPRRTGAHIVAIPVSRDCNAA